MYIAVVTGGTRGIGRAISWFLNQTQEQKGYQQNDAQQEIKVIALYNKDFASAQQFHLEYGVEIMACDVSDLESCKSCFADIYRKFHKIDILVNNAGITMDRMFHKMELTQWLNVINTNLNSLYYVTSQVINQMRAQEYGRIINIASINGLRGQVGQTNYSAAKAGMIGFTKALALENASKGITVNAIAPGYISTEMTDAIDEAIMQNITANIPMSRLGTPLEIAQACRFLIDSAFMTGGVLNINGGQYM